VAVAVRRAKARLIAEQAHAQVLGVQVASGESSLQAGSAIGCRVVDLHQVLEREFGHLVLAVAVLRGRREAPRWCAQTYRPARSRRW
jgi:hypothetical protein